MRNLGNISDLYEQVKLNEGKIKERKLTDAEKDKLKKLEKEVPMKDFKDRYGKEGESVYYATLTKMAKDEGFASDAQRRAAFAQGYKAKGKKGKKEETELDEAKFSSSMVDKLKKAYEPMRGKKINPTPLMKIFDKIDSNKEGLIQLYKADIPFVSMMAMSRLMLKHNYKASDINKLGKIRMEDFVEEVELDENRYMRGGVRLSFDDDPFGGKKMMIQIGTDTLDVPNSQYKNFLKLIKGLSDREFK